MPTDLTRLLESTVGADNLAETSVLTAGGLRSVPLVSPAESTEVSECLRICAREKAAVVPAGTMSWLECGNPLARADVVLSLRRLKRIVDYSPPDLTLTAEAGLTLKALNEATAEQRQWLPLDPPGMPDATIGAIAACASSGALRRGFGTPRDYVIGLRLAHPDGKTSKSGGRVVKNVAGYDLNKLYVGSFGTLALLTELTFKLRPLPEGDKTLVISGVERPVLLDLARRALQSREIMPSSIFLLDRRAAKGEASLAMRFVESEECVEHQIVWMHGATDCAGAVHLELRNEEAGRFWKDVVDLHSQSSLVVKLSLPLAELSDALTGWLTAPRGARTAIDLGTGIVRMGFDDSTDSATNFIEQLRTKATSIKGTLIVEQAPFEVKRRLDAWGDVGAASELMKAIKLKFDPEHLLNPGRFVCGI